MKTKHTGIVALVCAVVLVALWGGGLLSPSQPLDPADSGAAPLVPREPDREEGAGEEVRAHVSRSDAPQIEATEEPDPPARAIALTRLLARMVDEYGAPVACARIDVPSNERLGSAESDVTGRIELVVDRGLIRIWNGQALSQRFLITAKGHATRSVRVALQRDVDTNLGDLVLAPGAVVIGRVVDADLDPLEGVRVVSTGAALGQTAEAARRTGPREEREELLEVETRADGSYRLEGVVAEPRRIWAAVEGRPWAFTPPLEPAHGAETRAPDLVIERPAASARIAGRVLDPTGAPVAGATILASGLAAGPVRFKRAKSDGEGRFEVLALDDGPHRVGAFHPDRICTPTFERRVIPGTDDLELRFEKLRWIELYLVDERDGSRVEKPWINVEVNSGMQFARNVPRPKREILGPGHIRAPLPEGKFEIGASARGYGYKSVGPFEPGSMPAEYTIQLKRKPVVSGRVLADGKPVEGARVQTMRVMGAEFTMETQGFRTRLFDGGAFATQTDSDGRFEHPVSTSLRSGAHVVHVSKEGWATAERIVEVEGEDARDIEIVLTRGGAIEGLVILPLDRTPLGAIVAASNGDGVVRTVRADAEGRYRLELLRPGPWEVRYREEDEEFIMTQSAMAPLAPVEGDCVVIEGQTTHHDLRVRGEDVLLAGRLVIDGRPARGWTARLEDPDALGGEGIADSEVLDSAGAFSLASDGNQMLVVLETPETEATFVHLVRFREFHDSDASLEVRTGRLSGTASPGARLRFRVTIDRKWTWRAELRADAGGRFDLRLPPGTVTVFAKRVMPGMFTRWIEVTTVEMAPGAEARIAID